MSLRHVAIILLALVPITARAQSLTPVETSRIDAAVEGVLASTGVPSASIAVVRAGRIVLARAYGRQSDSRRTADPALAYQVASISKQFTAAAVLLLQRDGRLKLDDTVDRYVPGVSGGSAITIRQLLSHTSGLQDYWPQDYSFTAMSRPVTPAEIVDRWGRKPLDFAPGTQWQYSNTGYVVAGLIVEKVSGVPLMTFLQDRIFRPLKMTVVDQDDAVGSGYPSGYKRYALGPVRVETPAARGWLYAAGGLAMSASDLARWDVARLDREVLTAADWQAQETPVRLVDGSSTGYGLGVFAGVKDGRRFVEHNGEAAGFLSENTVYPDDRAAIVVLTNSWFSDATGQISRKLAEIVLPAAKQDAEDARALDRARKVFDQLLSGTLDRSLLTGDANHYFTPQALADYRSSLARLGAPSTFTQVGSTRLRGGYVNRRYVIRYAGRTLSMNTYAEKGPDGRFEQVLVAPSEG